MGIEFIGAGVHWAHPGTIKQFEPNGYDDDDDDDDDDEDERTHNCGNT